MNDLALLRKVVAFARENGIGDLWVTKSITDQRMQINSNWPLLGEVKKSGVPFQVVFLIDYELIAHHRVEGHEWVQDPKSQECRFTVKAQNMTLEKALDEGFTNILYVGE